MTEGGEATRSLTCWLVVLTWNGRVDTLTLLASLHAFVVPFHQELTVLVVDNGSTDQTLQDVASEHPWARTLQTGANLGYAGGNNAGISRALEQGADVVGVLNNDTVVTDDFLQPILYRLWQEPQAIISPDIRYFSSPEKSWFRGGTIDRWNARHLQQGEWPAGSFETEWLSGCAIFARSQIWQTVGPFDSWLFLLFEDLDWSLRARRHGYKLVVLPSSVLNHRVSSTINATASSTATFLWSRNGVVVLHRHLGLRPSLEFAVCSVFNPALRTFAKRGYNRRLAVTSLHGMLVGLYRISLGNRSRRMRDRLASRGHGHKQTEIPTID